MERRGLLGAAVAGGAAIAATLPMPAIAQSMPTVRWRMPSSFPRSLGTLYGGAEYICNKVAAITDSTL